jgi:Uma2 family endonuclease
MTAEDLEQMPDEEPGRYDLIDGELIRMPPPGEEHDDIALTLVYALGPFVRPRGPAKIHAGAGFVVGRNPDQVVSPDVAVIRTERLDPERDRRGYLKVAPDFAVEIVSPSDYPRIVQRKIDKYLEAGVPLLWILYPATRRVRVLGAGREPQELGEGDVLDAGDVVPGFRIPVAEIFR